MSVRGSSIKSDYYRFESIFVIASMGKHFVLHMAFCVIFESLQRFNVQLHLLTGL